MHTEEPNCAIKDAVNSNTIAADRYISYRNILDSIEEKKY
jgi:ribosome biogenesis GTPase / thiamine phosphate phosphatase